VHALPVLPGVSGRAATESGSGAVNVISPAAASLGGIATAAFAVMTVPAVSVVVTVIAAPMRLPMIAADPAGAGCPGSQRRH
jgi:hypothetical protein